MRVVRGWCVDGERVVASWLAARDLRRGGRAWRDGDACRGTGREGLMGGINGEVRAAVDGARLGVGWVDRCLGHRLELLLPPLLHLPNCPRICLPF